MLKLIVNCGPAEEYIAQCLASIRSQHFTDWQVFVTIDPCGDLTYHQAILARADDSRIHIHRNNERQYSMVNLIRAVERSEAQAEDLIVVLDGDDWFATPQALTIIQDTYARFDCWMTYGSWITDQDQMVGKWPAYPEGLTDFRGYEWLGTAVRTWKRWLWDFIDDQDFRDSSGNYFRVSEDQAVMLPMLEMSGTSRARHIEQVLMVYNRSSPHACGYTCRAEMLANAAYIRSLSPYPRLTAKPVSSRVARTFRSRQKTVVRGNTRDLTSV